MSKSKLINKDIQVAAIEAFIAKHEGRIGPRILLDDARDPRSPFHDYFEWDDDEAAEQYRLIQAGQLIRSWKGHVMKIDRATETVKIETVRRVQSPISQRSRNNSSYETVENIMADPIKREDMLQTVLRELAAYRRRYAELVALADVWSAIDEALDMYSPERKKEEGSTLAANI